MRQIVVSERTRRRVAAAYRATLAVQDMTIYPRWLYLGTLAIPVGGVARRSILLGMHEQIREDMDEQTLHFGLSLDNLLNPMPEQR